MENKAELIVLVLSEYKEINVLETQEEGVVFELHDAKYQMHMLDEDFFPIIYAIDNDSKYPHLWLRECTFKGRNYRYICLYESSTLIEYIHTDEEKIRACIDRLIALINLSQKEIVNEFQKEFLYYWEQSCLTNSEYRKNKYQLFIDEEEKYQWLEYQIYQYNCIRLTKSNRFFNDENKKKYVDEKFPVLYLPITNSQGIIPPTKDQVWGSKEINDIVNGVMYQRISTEAFQEIKNNSFSYGKIFIVFMLNSLHFGCIVKFKTPNSEKLLHKFESQIVDVIPVSIKRCDFEFLNRQIGNTSSNQHIVIVGVGSLGSYIASELVRSGYKNLTLIDDDTYEYENTFRHNIIYFSSGLSKCELMEHQLNTIHPEVNINVINDCLSSRKIDSYPIASADILIFAVGSSDVQLRMNKVFIKSEINVPTFYAWLEYNGESSHIAVVNDYKLGCFECLFTDNDGKLCQNIVNRVKNEEIQYIRNGCGGTRVPYGNQILLVTSAMLLKAIKENNGRNLIYSYFQDKIEIADFPKNERCNCCGLCE